MSTISEWVRRCGHWHRDRLALVSGERRFTYGQFDERVNRQVHALLGEGLQPGDRVAVITSNTAEAVEAVAAAARGGFVHVPISFRLSGREIGDILRHSGTSLLLLEDFFAEKAVQFGACPKLRRVVGFAPADPAASDYEGWLAACPATHPALDVTDDRDFLIVYTSGTTGAPKGVLHQQCQSVAHTPVPCHYYDMHADARLLSVYPHNSIAAINMYYLPAWMLGAAVVLSDARSFSAERWLQEVEQHRITHCHLVPTMLFRVLECAALADADLSSLQTVGYGSAPMPLERVRRLSEVFGDILVQGYGMTEISSLAAVLDKAAHRAALAGDGSRLAACGRPVFGCELRVVDDDGRDVPPDTIGEIIFRGPQRAAGYWQDPERTAEAIRDGWMHSGDLARLDRDGFLYIVDRKSDLIISGGANIASKEVEEVIYWHPAVQEVAVVGRPDEEWGERVHAFVVCHGGQALDEATLVAFCRERLSHYKCPDRVEFVAELPKNALGKCRKSDLRKQLAQRKERNAAHV